MSSTSKQVRIVRKDPGIKLTRNNYRKKALPYLLADFEDRCAYSMERLAKLLEVDHFNPNLKKDPIQKYDNLFPASRHCNRSKGSTWPTLKMEREGIRFLDCTKEIDYGTCIFEDPQSHELIGTTPAAKWHIHQLDLNAPFLVRHRRERAVLRQKIQECFVRLKKPIEDPKPFLDLIQEVRGKLDDMIPEIPPPPM